MIDWKPIPRIPSELKDRRAVLVWGKGGPDIAAWHEVHWSASNGETGAWVSTFDEMNPVEDVTHYSEINRP